MMIMPNKAWINDAVCVHGLRAKRAMVVTVNDG
jgi:hypothetical protein